MSGDIGRIVTITRSLTVGKDGVKDLEPASVDNLQLRAP
jgi:hypothetical protein